MWRCRQISRASVTIVSFSVQQSEENVQCSREFRGHLFWIESESHFEGGRLGDRNPSESCGLVLKVLDRFPRRGHEVVAWFRFQNCEMFDLAGCADFERKANESFVATPEAVLWIVRLDGGNPSRGDQG